MPMTVFPNGFVAYSHLILGAGVPTLIDVGSGFGDSTQDLLNGIEAVRIEHGETIHPQDVERIIITHGHVDHFGGLSSVLEAINGATVGVHPLDRRILANHEERVVVATKDLAIYLERAGVRDEHLKQLLSMYGFSKQHVRSVNVDFMIEEGDNLDGMTFYHVPGHCSGQVAIRIGDVLLSADHILSRTSPHLAPESITHYTGLGHYRESLRKIRALDDIRLTLGNHEDVIHHLHSRIDHLQQRIDEKLDQILSIIRETNQPMTIKDISLARYDSKHGFDVLLAIQEAGAYVEYLYDRGYLSIANLSEIDKDENTTLMYAVL